MLLNFPLVWTSWISISARLYTDESGITGSNCMVINSTNPANFRIYVADMVKIWRFRFGFITLT